MTVRSAKSRVRHERLVERLDYDPASGAFAWKVTAGSAAPRGSTAGSIYSNGYRVIAIDGKDYGAHRLAWFYVHREWPAEGMHIDHINGIRDDNRIGNLRVVTASMNSQNRRRVSRTKTSCDLLGATWDAMWRNWKAQLTHKGKTVYIGRFSSAEEAHVAYLKVKRQLHDGCTL